MDFSIDFFSMAYSVYMYCLLGACVAISAPVGLLHAVGFGKTGIRSNSLAAWWQARWRGTPNKDDFFAKLQSWGATGFPGYYNIYFGFIGFALVGLIADNYDASAEMLPPEFL